MSGRSGVSNDAGFVGIRDLVDLQRVGSAAGADFPTVSAWWYVSELPHGVPFRALRKQTVERSLAGQHACNAVGEFVPLFAGAYTMTPPP